MEMVFALLPSELARAKAHHDRERAERYRDRAAKVLNEMNEALTTSDEHRVDAGWQRQLEDGSITSLVTTLELQLACSQPAR